MARKFKKCYCPLCRDWRAFAKNVGLEKNLCSHASLVKTMRVTKQWLKDWEEQRKERKP